MGFGKGRIEREGEGGRAGRRGEACPPISEIAIPPPSKFRDQETVVWLMCIAVNCDVAWQ